jgi:NTP pyrophosphatase (non-canonical NTP hydrolase)
MMGPSQTEVSEWLIERFGPERDLLAQFKKLEEEALELGDAVSGVLGHEGCVPVGGWTQNLRDETADVVIVCMAIAVTEGFSLSEAVASKWSRRKRGAIDG